MYIIYADVAAIGSGVVASARIKTSYKGLVMLEDKLYILKI